MQEPERFIIEPKKEDYDRITNKLREGERVYLINEFYHTAIKVIPGTMDYEAKYKGGARYPIKSSTDLVCETIEEAKEITEEEYNRY